MSSRIVSFVGYGVLVGFCLIGELNAQRKSALSSFYIAAHVFSDAYPRFFEYILDVRPDGNGSVIRHIRIAPPETFCPNVVTVRGIETKVESSPEVLLKGVNLCSIDVKDFDRSIKRASRKSSIFDTVGYSVVAACGNQKKVFHVPYVDTLDLESLRRLSRPAFELTDLYSQLDQRLFPNQPINGTTHPMDFELQLIGESFVPELKSGRYDQAFGAGQLQTLMQGYRGPVKSATVSPELINKEQWSFLKFVNPSYPPLAKQAQLQGKVDLELSVDATGKVSRVTLLSGHPLLKDSAITAAQKWVFDLAQLRSSTVPVSIDYSLVCEVH